MTSSRKSILNLLETVKVNLITTQETALYMHVGEIVNHPIFGRIRIDGIYPNDSGHEAFTVLLEFNNTHRMFDLLELARLKFKQGSLQAVS